MERIPLCFRHSCLTTYSAKSSLRHVPFIFPSASATITAFVGLIPVVLAQITQLRRSTVERYLAPLIETAGSLKRIPTTPPSTPIAPRRRNSLVKAENVKAENVADWELENERRARMKPVRTNGFPASIQIPETPSRFSVPRVHISTFFLPFIPVPAPFLSSTWKAFDAQTRITASSTACPHLPSAEIYCHSEVLVVNHAEIPSSSRSPSPSLLLDKYFVWLWMMQKLRR
ncbi:hypothetical protein B0H16DRAFT_1879547 [Mycena metata]|uniref:Uncharacterized protein n=1 Tax=Mycena metata TaxID=1033252 RepID=A0AAD7K111_9AGAR|nr:hypothetical protein B0H16DRAFT_1879547 [Mycena metata]